MSENDLLDINIVCKMLNTTSRALRFYEEKGIINSTTVDFSIRRHYSKEQIDHIRNVLVLRKLGLSLKSISELQTNNLDLRAAITSKRAEIYALIAEKNRELTILNETIEKIDSGEDIYKEKSKTKADIEKSRCETIKKCSQAYIDNDIDLLYQFFISKIKEYMPINSFKYIREEALEPAGRFVCFDHIENDPAYTRIYYHYIRFEKIGINIKYVFSNDKISGFWVNYYNMEGKK